MNRKKQILSTSKAGGIGGPLGILISMLVGGAAGFVEEKPPEDDPTRAVTALETQQGKEFTLA